MAAWLAAAPATASSSAGTATSAPTPPPLRRLLAGTGLRDSGAQDDAPTYPADFPTARIDFILASPSLSLENFRVLDTRVSDHRPVVADFTRPG